MLLLDSGRTVLNFSQLHLCTSSVKARRREPAGLVLNDSRNAAGESGFCGHVPVSLGHRMGIALPPLSRLPKPSGAEEIG